MIHLRYLSSARLPTEKAHGIQIASMCDAFTKAGASVELVLPKRSNKGKEPRDLFQYYHIPETFHVRTLPVTDLTPFTAFMGKIAHAVLYRSFARSAFNDARKSPADIYYIRDEQTFIRFTEDGLPTVFEIHTLPHNIKRFKEAFDKCIAIISISHHLKEELIDMGVSASKIFVAPDGADLKRFSPGIPKEDARKELGLNPDTQVAIYTGQLFSWKGVETLIDAASKLTNNQEVIIVGGGAGFEKPLKERVVNTGAKVRFEGQVPHNKIPLYLAAADCVVVPTSGKERIGSHHTSPLKLFEAMAMGKAIIASDVPSLREILDETSAVFFTADDPLSLSKNLSKLLADQRFCAKIGATARDKAQNYDWKTRAEAILTFIRRVDKTL